MLKIKLPQAFFLFLFFWFEQFSYAQDNFFNLYTEDYAPYNMPKDDTNGDNENEIVGSATDIMKEIFKRANIKYKMELLPWARAYNNALTKKNAVVFAASRTEEREKLFKWVGPIGENDWVLFSLANPHTKMPYIKIKSLEEAKNYVIGAYKGDATSNYLHSISYLKVEDTNLDLNNEKKLQAGRIDLWASGKQLGNWFFKKNKIINIVPVYTLKTSILYAAFNKETDEKVIEKLNATLKDIQKDGTYAKIINKYAN
nr:ABC transporter substrate-binding protein [Pigmentibacter ruber]